MTVGEVLQQKHSLNQFHIGASEFLCWKEKRDVAKSGEYLQAYAPCIICGISESLCYSLGKCFLLFFFSAKWVITHSLCSCLVPLTSYPCRSCPSSSDTTAARRARCLISWITTIILTRRLCFPSLQLSKPCRMIYWWTKTKPSLAISKIRRK